MMETVRSSAVVWRLVISPFRRFGFGLDAVQELFDPVRRGAKVQRCGGLVLGIGIHPGIRHHADRGPGLVAGIDMALQRRLDCIYRQAHADGVGVGDVLLGDGLAAHAAIWPGAGLHLFHQHTVVGGVFSRPSTFRPGEGARS
jgi:hypothetical protein